MTSHIPSVDPVTVEVIHHSLIAASREMGVTLRNTSCSPIFNEGNDYSCGICDAEGRLVSHGEFIPAHLGSLPFSVKAAVAAFGMDGLHDGDAVILNDPYSGGSHLPDITIVSPIVVDQCIVGFAANRAHHLDVGGTVPGSFYSEARENYQEGLRISPIKLFSRGSRDDRLLELILTNCRLPEQMRIDLESQVSANRTAIDRLRRLHLRYGSEVVHGAMEALLNYSERRMREIIASWPDGDYSASDFMDNDGVTDEPKEIRVTVRIRGSEAIVDFTGSAPQTAGPLNAVLGYVHSGVRMTFQAATDPDIPPNDGCYRPIKVVAPLGSIVNPIFPAPCTGGNEAVFIIHNVVFRALAKIPGEVNTRPRVMACDQGSSNNLFLAGTDPRSGKRYVLYEYPEGGWGGNSQRDGLTSVFSIVGNTWNIPVEAVERRFPVRLERYEYCCDSGGPGTYRGGLGVRRDYRPINHESILNFVGNRAKIRPWGLDGGLEGGAAAYLLDADSPNERPASPVMLSKGTMITVHPNQLVTQKSAGGGGWGDPLERDPMLVAKDARNQYISLGAAHGVYGVVLDTQTWEPVLDRTASLRARLRAERLQKSMEAS